MVEPPVPDPLAAAQYLCLYWVDHLLDCDRGHTNKDVINGGSVHRFLRTSFVFWLEALSLLKSLPDSVGIIIKLENWIKVSHVTILRMPVGSAILSKINKFDESPDLHTFIHDARRFAVST
jgi:hypothetical protein